MNSRLTYSLLLFSALTISLYSCTPEEFQESGPPLEATPIDTNSIIDSQVYSFAGQTWVVDRYRIGLLGETNLISDTLLFYNNVDMLYNTVQTNYALYPSASVYVLSMYQTPWGFLSGSVNPYNLKIGEILGLPFSNISLGGNSLQVYLWMHRI